MRKQSDPRGGAVFQVDDLWFEQWTGPWPDMRYTICRTTGMAGFYIDVIEADAGVIRKIARKLHFIAARLEAARGRMEPPDLFDRARLLRVRKVMEVFERAKPERPD